MPRINLAFGSLNPITKPKIGVNYKDNSPVSTLKNSAEKYYDSNAFENQGTLLAICLKIEPQLFPPPTSWPFNTLGEEYANNKVWFSVRARIPEIHSCIPDPLSYGDNVTDTALQHINMHPLFLSQTPIEKLGSELPVPGDIIEVDFQNRENLTGGVFIRKVIEGEVKSADLLSASSKFKEIYSSVSQYGAAGGKSGPGLVSNSSVVAAARERIDREGNPNCQNLTDEQLLNEAAFEKGKCLGRIKTVPIPGNTVGLVPEAAQAFKRMYAAAAAAGEDIKAGSNRHTWRSMQNQIDLKNDPYLRRIGTRVSPPGRSNHQKGVAVDIPKAKPRNGATTTPAYEWLKANAKTYDFYQPDATEKWHWVYKPNGKEYVIKPLDKPAYGDSNPNNSIRSPNITPGMKL